ncbi:hypothetical protein [uncultured Jatrophihabitans sp.]|uniref:hypothetical protein n=1 Tax=uncultured Jatrophihabitans sp. TaxID=1610747 RepID=UPI0035CBFFDB
MAEVFLCKTGQLKPASRKALRDVGVVVVEVDDPSTCQFVRSEARVSGDEMLHAAIRALRHDGGYGEHGGQQRTKFMVSMFDLIEAATSSECPS